MRVSLGASRWRIVRQLLIESVVLSVGRGSSDSCSRSSGFARLIRFWRPMSGSLLDDVRSIRLVVTFFAVICVGTGILFGLAPAFHVSKTDVNAVMKDAGAAPPPRPRARRWTGALIVAEVTLTLVLLGGAAFMMRSFLTLYRMDVGTDTSRVLTMRVTLPLTKYPQPIRASICISRSNSGCAASARSRRAV